MSRTVEFTIPRTDAHQLRALVQQHGHATVIRIIAAFVEEAGQRQYSGAPLQQWQDAAHALDQAADMVEKL